MSEEVYITCFDPALADDFISFIDKQGLGCTKMMGLNASEASYNMVQLTVLGASMAAVAKAIHEFIKERKIEISIELKLETKTTTIGKQSSTKEIENALTENKLQQFILKTKI